MVPPVGYDQYLNPLYMDDYNDIKVDTTPTGPGLGFYSAWSDFSRIVRTDGGTRTDQDVVFARQDFPPALSRGGPAGTSAPELAAGDPKPKDRGTTISFVVGGGATGPVEIGIYDVAGRLVSRLASPALNPGRHEMAWDGRGEGGESVRPGMYFVRALQADRPVVCSTRILYMR